ncbi:MAG: HEPN domain-containing protein [Nitrospirae bacterium]|nr:HEPN domain-containing protein [Magnetococcales bacterium]
MKDLEQAHMLLAMAEKDARALAVMGDAEAVATEIFGLHVQQAVEKGLKAWLCLLGVRFAKRHDLDELAAQLEDAGQSVPEAFAPLLTFTDFAVTFRYEAFPEFEADLDRATTTVLVERFLAHVRQRPAWEESEFEGHNTELPP